MLSLHLLSVPLKSLAHVSNSHALLLHPATHFNSNIVKELPRVMTIYDVDMPVKEARAAIQYAFRKNASLEDGGYVNR